MKNYNLNEDQLDILKILSECYPIDFIRKVKVYFSINTLCDILKINRNRYNYLKRTNQLDFLLLELHKEVKTYATKETS